MLQDCRKGFDRLSPGLPVAVCNGSIEGASDVRAQRPECVADAFDVSLVHGNA